MFNEYDASSNNNLENLKALSKDNSLIFERRLLEIYELVNSICSNIKKEYGEISDVYELLSLISEEYNSAKYELHEEHLDDNTDMLERNIGLLDNSDKVLFCDLLINYSENTNLPIAEKSFIPIKSGGQTFTYVKNPIADEAYEVFTEALEDPKVFYSSGLKEAVLKVFSGEVDFCLLPLEEKGDRIHTVNQLILSYDLKIVDISPVFGPDGLADMKYAVVGKHMYLPSAGVDDDRYLEVRLPSQSDLTLGQIISAAELLSNIVYRINTETLRFENSDKNYYTVVFHDEGGGFARILTYLTLSTGAYIPVGIYKNLE